MSEETRGTIGCVLMVILMAVVLYGIIFGSKDTP